MSSSSNRTSSFPPKQLCEEYKKVQAMRKASEKFTGIVNRFSISKVKPVGESFNNLDSDLKIKTPGSSRNQSGSSSKDISKLVGALSIASGGEGTALKDQDPKDKLEKKSSSVSTEKFTVKSGEMRRAELESLGEHAAAKQLERIILKERQLGGQVTEKMEKDVVAVRLVAHVKGQELDMEAGTVACGYGQDIISALESAVDAALLNELFKD